MEAVLERVNGKVKKAAQEDKRVQISPPNIQVAEFRIVGTAPYVQNKFSHKAKQTIRATHEAGSTARSKKKREARDFEADYEAAQHRSKEGWLGIPAPAFRNALIDACRLVGFKMTHAKLAVWADKDGIDPEDGTPLVRIEGEPEMHVGTVRNQSGVVDLRARPMWKEWAATLRLHYDADQFSLLDITNLLHRVGLQVGIGEGRPNSKSSNGMGWGTFEIASE